MLMLIKGLDYNKCLSDAVVGPEAVHACSRTEGGGWVNIRGRVH